MNILSIVNEFCVFNFHGRRNKQFPLYSIMTVQMQLAVERICTSIDHQSPPFHHQVFYGSAVTNPTDFFLLGVLTEHWLHPGGPKRESGRYHISSQFFVPNTRLAALVQAVESSTPPLVLTAEICGLHYSRVVSGDVIQNASL